ncbi:hypothetical protein SK128_015297 [Halocaridina rubra]|uniref:rRNA biogenesis protein RRP36 n=1 Tax=Halocaridina rubra TaxID=373956 RepID=A0AAN8WTS9_HALRR
MWRDQDEDEFGYSVTEKSKLKTANSNRKTHIKFNNSDESEGESQSKATSFQKKKKDTSSLSNSDSKFRPLNYNLSNNDTHRTLTSIGYQKNRKHTYSDSNANKNVERESDSTSGSEDDNDDEECDKTFGNVNKITQSDDSDNDSEEGVSEDETVDYDNMTMEELLKLQDKIGTRAFRDRVLKVEKPEAKTEIKKSYKRLNKNRPSEMPLMRKTAPRLKLYSSGKRVKEVIHRDPRFDDLSGKLSMNLWDKQYSFLKELRRKDMETLRKAFSQVKSKDKKSKIKLMLQRMENQEREHKKREQEQEIKSLERKQQREAYREGEKPKFMSNKVKKAMLKAKHFEELKKANKVDKYLERKEKKQLRREMKRNM